MVDSKDIFIDLNKLSSKENIYKLNLLEILKKYSRIISPYDLMIATAILKEDGKYVQTQYRQKFLEIYVKYFIMRIKEILDNNSIEDENIDKKLFEDSLGNIKHQFNKDREEQKKNSKFPLIYTIICLYTTFILEEPIHPVGSIFPGNQKVEEIDNEFYCPVKKNQEDNPNAVCQFCLAKQTPEK